MPVRSNDARVKQAQAIMQLIRQTQLMLLLGNLFLQDSNTHTQPEFPPFPTDQQIITEGERPKFDSLIRSRYIKCASLVAHGRRDGEGEEMRILNGRHKHTHTHCHKSRHKKQQKERKAKII